MEKSGDWLQRTSSWMLGRDLKHRSNLNIAALRSRWEGLCTAAFIGYIGSMGVVAFDFFAGDHLDVPGEVHAATLLGSFCAFIAASTRRGDVEAESSRRTAARQEVAIEQERLDRFNAFVLLSEINPHTQVQPADSVQ